MSLRDFVMGAISFLWQAFVFAKLWSWYMVPLFHLPAMGVVGAIGVCLITSVLCHQFSAVQPMWLTDEPVGEDEPSLELLEIVHHLILFTIGFVFSFAV